MSNLTNRITTIRYTQRGEVKVLEFRGELKQAMDALKSRGVTRVTSGKTQTIAYPFVMGTLCIHNQTTNSYEY